VTGNWLKAICAGGELLTEKLKRKATKTIAKNQHYFALDVDAPNNQNKGLPPDASFNAGCQKQSRLIA